MRRIPQPPIDPAARDPERHGFWRALVAAFLGLSILITGARHSTGVETAQGGAARETQLMKAFSSGGLQFPDQVAPPPPPKFDNSPQGLAALQRWEKQSAAFTPPTWLVRVDTSAKTPCPT